MGPLGISAAKETLVRNMECFERGKVIEAVAWTNIVEELAMRRRAGDDLNALKAGGDLQWNTDHSCKVCTIMRTELSHVCDMVVVIVIFDLQVNPLEMWEVCYEFDQWLDFARGRVENGGLSGHTEILERKVTLVRRSVRENLAGSRKRQVCELG